MAENNPFLSREARIAIAPELGYLACERGFLEAYEGIPVDDTYALAKLLATHCDREDVQNAIDIAFNAKDNSAKPVEIRDDSEAPPLCPTEKPNNDPEVEFWRGRTNFVQD